MVEGFAGKSNSVEFSESCESLDKIGFRLQVFYFFPEIILIGFLVKGGFKCGLHLVVLNFLFIFRSSDVWE